MTFHQIVFLTWMRQDCIGKSYRQDNSRKIGAWLQVIQRQIYSTPWSERITNSKIKAITGVSLQNSQSNERHSKISFACYLDFKKKGLGQAINFLRMLF